MIDPYFDPKITLGSVLVAGSMLLAASTSVATAIIAWRDLNWRVKNAEKWQEEHERTCRQNDRILGELREMITEMKALAEASEKRLGRVEDVVFPRGSFPRRG